jgi:hypothetical protein
MQRVWGAKFNDLTPAFGRLQGSDKVIEPIMNSDGLCSSVHSTRWDHDWQSFSQVAHHFRREAPGSDDHACTKLGDRNVELSQGITGLLPRLQMHR